VTDTLDTVLRHGRRFAASARARGLALMFISVFLFTLMSALIRLLGTSYPVSEIIFARSLFGFIPILFLLPSSGGWTAFHLTHPLSHLVRSFLGLLSISLYFLSLTYLTLAEAVSLSFAAPLFTVVLAIPILKERVSFWGWAAVISGFGGVLIILGPSVQTVALGAFIAILGALCNALSRISLRRLSAVASSATIVIYLTFSMIAVSGAVMCFEFKMPTALDGALLALMGLIGGTGQILVTIAHRLSPATLLAPLEYFAMIWSVVLSYAMFQEVPGAMVVLGSFVIVAAGIFVTLSSGQGGSR
jgi:drug/metabolite transporter (DMT)-like permease